MYADKLGIETDPKRVSHGKLVEVLWEHHVGDHLFAPTFVRDFPVETSPLVRDHRAISGVVEKWDLYVRGFELATAYSELVDPVIQRERFEAQALLAAAGDDEAMRVDEDFLTAMEYALPPAGGIGLGHRPLAHGTDRAGHPRDDPVPPREAARLMNPLLTALAALLPSIGVGLLFWFAIRALVNADRTERQALARMDAAERAAEVARNKEQSGPSV